MILVLIRSFALCLLLIPCPAGQSVVSAESTFLTDDTIRNAYRRGADGFSTDELLIRDALRTSFLNELGIDPQHEPDADRERSALSRLLNLRKRGKLEVPTTHRSHSAEPRSLFAAEIAVRTVTDRHRVSVDDVLCDRNLRNELQREAQRVVSDADAESIRRTALQLRKHRRLRPELVLRVADWETDVRTFALSDLPQQNIPHAPGIYLFRNHDGYLYIGEAIDLAVRIDEHLAGTHNTGLATVLQNMHDERISLELHVFANDSPARKVSMRRAYESELIRSRNPKFNLRP